MRRLSSLLLALVFVLGLSPRADAAWTVRTPTANWNNAGSYTATEPTGCAQHDMLLWIVVTDKASTFPTPTGWTIHPSFPITLSSSAMYAWYIADRGASAPSFASGTITGPSYYEWHIHCFNGHDTASPLAAFASTGDVTTNNPDPPAATASSAGSLAIAAWENWNNGGTWVAPTGYSNLATVGGGFDMGSASKQLVGAGSEDPAAPTGGGGSSASSWAGTFIINPVGGSPPASGPKRLLTLGVGGRPRPR